MTGRRHALIAHLALAAVAFAFLLPFAVQSVYAGFVWDDAFYLLRADALFGRLDDAPDLAAAMREWRSYPPLWPLVLGLAGGGSRALLPAFVANVACIVAWLAAFLWWLRRAGTGSGTGFLLAIAALFAPFTLYYAQTLWSEHLYLAFALAALAAAEHGLATRRALVATAVLVTLAALTRTAGIALAIAFALLLAWRRPRDWLLAAMLPLAAIVVERVLNPGRDYVGALVGATAHDDPLARIDAIAGFLGSSWTAGWSFQ
ncbi:MAG TPA: hypothetical protein VFL14_15380, partial [Xanthomonadales bacterium]|nr:hypothetical protein [Xanthomonadales bacterium]